MHDDTIRTAAFFAAAIRQLGGYGTPASTAVLDFGCGRGQLVEALCRTGFDAYGCDLPAFWSGETLETSARLYAISLSPYRLPCEENSFDIVISTSVLEHAQNKAELFREIHRVLKPGGYSMHLYPGKWYLPYEPHIFVPLVNFFWPHCPRWWLRLWARLGVRNEFQQGHRWKDVVAHNDRYCREGLSYWTNRQYRELSLEIFGNCEWPMRFYIEHAPGGFARLFRKLPFKSVSGVLAREVRMGFLVQRKAER